MYSAIFLVIERLLTKSFCCTCCIVTVLGSNYCCDFCGCHSVIVVFAFVVVAVAFVFAVAINVVVAVTIIFVVAK